MKKKYLDSVKKLIESKFKHCTANWYIEPTISSVLFIITCEGFNHIYKAPYGLLETPYCSEHPEALSEMIIDEVKAWRKKYEA